MKKYLALLSLLVLLAPQFASAAACSALTPTVAYWKLDGNSNDATGNGHTGADTSMSYSTTNAIINQAGQFNGSTSKILVPDNSGFDSPTTGVSINAWFDYTGGSIGTVIENVVAKSTVSAATGQYLRLYIQNGKLAAVPNGDLGSQQIIGGTSLVANTLYMGTFTYDGTNEHLYLNGVSDATPIAYSGATTPSTGSVGIGVLGDLAAQFFLGAIDEAGWWTCGLTSSQVTTLYNSDHGLQYPFTVANPAIFTGFWHVF